MKIGTTQDAQGTAEINNLLGNQISDEQKMQANKEVLASMGSHMSNLSTGSETYGKDAGRTINENTITAQEVLDGVKPIYDEDAKALEELKQNKDSIAKDEANSKANKFMLLARLFTILHNIGYYFVMLLVGRVRVFTWFKLTPIISGEHKEEREQRVADKFDAAVAKQKAKREERLQAKNGGGGFIQTFLSFFKFVKILLVPAFIVILFYVIMPTFPILWVVLIFLVACVIICKFDIGGIYLGHRTILEKNGDKAIESMTQKNLNNLSAQIANEEARLQTMKNFIDALSNYVATGGNEADEAQFRTDVKQFLNECLTKDEKNRLFKETYQHYQRMMK